MQEHNQCTFKTNVDVIKDLNEPEPPTDNVVELDVEASRLVKGNTRGKDGGKPRIACYWDLLILVYVFLVQLLELLPISSYEEIHGNINPNPFKLEPIDTTILLSNRTIKLPL
jgi:hypothetical protein